MRASGNPSCGRGLYTKEARADKAEIGAYWGRLYTATSDQVAQDVFIMTGAFQQFVCVHKKNCPVYFVNHFFGLGEKPNVAFSWYLCNVQT